ncbi:hypothetical protein JKF63_04149 [Porcisia hertigi]|uniref:Dynein assembly factor 1, axonemal homolog n=1 Tax=Porcisia hertigi TaxID=2761500 RepID=A0A836I2T4_9TRYP|nr:hypothetical protein JKF63_04149 [Porcisia hertigi]
MSSIDISSTNDVTSAAASDRSGSLVTNLGGVNSRSENVLTTDRIIRECIKQGFYRNPICNEKLYLHNRGYDSIAPTAFEPYTDVKVLWLEANGFSALPCGESYTQVRPPVRVDPFAVGVQGNEAEGAAVPAGSPAQHFDPNKETMPHRDVLSSEPPGKRKPLLPLAADVPPENRDVFSSLYPTVRQLFLHNNLFRTMPDLSRFERLDTVNLSGNFFSTVEPHCTYYDTAVHLHRAKEAGDAVPPTESITRDTRRSPSKSLLREQEQLRQQFSNDPHSTDRTTAPADVIVVASSDDAKQQRALQLERYRHTADVFAVFCEHSPPPEREETQGEAHQPGALPSLPRAPLLPAPEHRNPCSSLRSLNLSGNRLESFEDCLGLLCYHSLAVLDLSHNHISDGEALLLILERLPRLQSLKLSGNPLVRSLPRYRKRVLSRCKRLLHLDDLPVFDEERRIVTAWAISGDDGEEKERRAIQEERRLAEKKRLDDFRRLISRHQRAGAGEAPHADYINAITTVTALSEAADTAVNNNRNRAGREGARTPRQRYGRSSPSNRDSSSTSSENEEDAGDNHVGSCARVWPAMAMAPVMAGGGDDMADHGAASADVGPATSSQIRNPHENKPSRGTPGSSSLSAHLQQPQRVLSSNQCVEVAASGGSHEGVAGSGKDDDDDDDNIFVPDSV